MLSKHARMVKIAQQQEVFAERFWDEFQGIGPIPYHLLSDGYTGLERGLVSCMLAGVPYPHQEED